MYQLRALGICAEAESIYLELMTRGALSVEELTVGNGSADGPLTELAAIGLVERADGKVLPPPHLAMEALAQRQAREADPARESGGRPRAGRCPATGPGDGRGKSGVTRSSIDSSTLSGVE